MKQVYPVVLSPAKEGGYAVYVPDFDCNTQGEDAAEAIEMARDVIGLMGIELEDEGKPLPEPTPVSAVHHQPGDIVTLVDVDFTAYRRAHEQRTVRRNVSLPSWLNAEAERAGLNVSAVLQDALKTALRIDQ